MTITANIVNPKNLKIGLQLLPDLDMGPFSSTQPTDEQTQPNPTHGSVHIDPTQPTNAMYDQLKSAVNTMFTFILVYNCNDHQ